MIEVRQSYHHGNLRETLVQAGLEVLENAGAAALSLRAIATAAGVSRSAPYAHFKDRGALLSAVANVGFSRMAGAMASAASRGTTPKDRFVSIGCAYVGFAIDNPNMFKLMFSAELGSRVDQAAVEGSESYTFLRESLADLMEAVQQPFEDIIVEASAWSMVHGLSLLLIEGRLQVPRADRDKFIHEVTGRLAEMLQR